MKYAYMAAAVLFLLVVGFGYTEYTKVCALEETNKALVSERDAATKDAVSFSNAKNSWMAQYVSCNTNYEHLQLDVANQNAANAKAVIETKAQYETRINKLADIVSKVSAAQRAGPCATILNTPVCKEAFQ